MRPRQVLSPEWKPLPLAPVFRWRLPEDWGDTGALSRIPIHLRDAGYFCLFSFSGCLGFWSPCASSATTVWCVLVESLHPSLLSFFLPRVKLWESYGLWGRPLRSATSWACSTHSRMQMARKTGRAKGTAMVQETQVGTMAAEGEDLGWKGKPPPTPRASLLSYLKTNSNNFTITSIMVFFLLFSFCLF